MEATNFDKHGFLFFLKFVVVFGVLLFGTRATAQVVFSSLYVVPSQSVVSASSAEKEIRREVALVQRNMDQALIREQKLALETERVLGSRIIAGERVGDLIASGGTFIAADLHLMQLSLYQEGVLLKTIPILSIGKPGSYWETPTGRYEILYKEESHFSSFGGVYMPYSMQFFGNFFIHGWPYYPDGRDVAFGYSGGCIRLSTEDAKMVYEFAKHTMPVFVYNDKESSIAPHIRVKNNPIPNVSAGAFLVADITSGRVYTEKESATAFSIASLTKLMTAVIASETINVERTVPVSGVWPEQTVHDYGSIEKGETFSVLTLLYPLLMESNNAVAHSIASLYGEQSFIDWMNKKAKAIGALNTTFADASGISSGNRSTASDIFTLARYLVQNRSFLLSVSKTQEKRVVSENNSAYTFVNNHPFAESPSFLGGKTGYTTAARETLLSIFSVPVGQSTTTIAIVVLFSNDRAKDTSALLEWFQGAVVH